MVVVNLYPFESIIECSDCDLPMVIENIDIGSLTMIRSAVKNHKDVAIVISSTNYQAILTATIARLPPF